MENLVDEVLQANRKKLFGSRPIFERYEPDNCVDIASLERSLGFKFPIDLREWLDTVGFGDLDQQLAIRVDWLNVIDQGELFGHVIFGQDDLGNFYSFDQDSGHIHYICRSAPEYALLATSFVGFLEELIRRDYDIVSWANSLAVSSYTRDG